MISKEHRLNKKQLGNVMTKGRRFRGDLFDIKYLQSDSSKIGIIISKKVNKSAVVRNKIRRKLKAWFINEFRDKYDFEIVFIIKSDSLYEIKNEEIRTLLEDFLKYIGKIKNRAD